MTEVGNVFKELNVDSSLFGKDSSSHQKKGSDRNDLSLRRQTNVVNGLL